MISICFYYYYGNKKFNLKSHMFKLYCLLVIVVSLSCVDSCSFYKKETKIELDKNGYKRILVAIDEDVKENHELIERIKHTFTSASQLLFEVTK